MTGPTIAVYGATGHTARFVAREIAARGIACVPIGRRGADWETSLPCRTAPCDDPDALDRALAGAGAVINCAGPFLDTAPAVVEAALRAGIHYVDLTAEQRSARQTLATYHEDARRAGTVIAPAMAFYGGLADLLATAAIRGARAVDSVHVAVALDSWHPTAGTRRTGERNCARRLIVEHGNLVGLPSPPPAGRWQFPPPFGAQRVQAVPLSEIITIARHIPARSVCSYMNHAPLKDLADPGTPPPVPADPQGRSSQRFMVDVAVQTDRGQRRLVATGQDIYAVSASIAVEACTRILRLPGAVRGAFAPGELFDIGDFLAALSPHTRVAQVGDTVALEAA